METLPQKVGVYGFVLNEENELLIVQRAAHDSMPGIWELPGGGLEVGEEVEAAVKREVKEECSLDVDVTIPIQASAAYSANRKKYVTRIAFLCKPVRQAPNVLLSTDHASYQWITVERLMESALPLSDFLSKLINDKELVSKIEGYVLKR